jgi:hypothetical protein
MTRLFLSYRYRYLVGLRDCEFQATYVNPKRISISVSSAAGPTVPCDPIITYLPSYITVLMSPALALLRPCSGVISWLRPY